ncbi:MAG TPA: hypothetical protein VH120_19495 [Gemmataceae bacterium]|nr:hypothetical protein [Gemmataceae bacterium]
MLVARTVIVPRIATARRRILPNNPAVTIQQLMTMFATRTIVGAALIEGAAFFLLVAYLAEGQPWTWVGGMVMGVLLAALQAPTRARAEAAFAADRQAIEDQRAAL